MISIKKIFASNLKNIRKQRGLTQEKFAELIDVQTRNMTALETAKYLPTPQNIDKICAKLKTPPSALFSIPDELVESDKLEKIEQICEKLKILDDRELNIIYNIVNNVFK